MSTLHLTTRNSFNVIISAEKSFKKKPPMYHLNTLRSRQHLISIKRPNFFGIIEFWHHFTVTILILIYSLAVFFFSSRLRYGRIISSQLARQKAFCARLIPMCIFISVRWSKSLCNFFSLALAHCIFFHSLLIDLGPFSVCLSRSRSLSYWLGCRFVPLDGQRFVFFRHLTIFHSTATAAREKRTGLHVRSSISFGGPEWVLTVTGFGRLLLIFARFECLKRESNKYIWIC